MNHEFISQTNYTVDKYTVKQQFRIAIQLWNDGFPYKCSTNITEEPSYGYGELDNNGFFEHPFPTELANLDIIAAENKIRWSKQR